LLNLERRKFVYWQTVLYGGKQNYAPRLADLNSCFLILKKEYAQAKQALEMAISLRPYYGKAYLNMGRVYLDLKEYEKNLRLDDAQIYNEFANRVKQEREKLINFINEEIKKGKKIYIYGASTKGNTLLQYYNLNNTYIKAATDKNKDKHGKFTVGSLIPIIPVEQYRAESPDYLLLLPWHFLKEIKEQEKEFLQKGGKIIVPLPEFKVVGL